MKKLTVVKAEVGKDLEVVTVEHTLDEMHKLVEGYIETVRIADDILLVVNEEGLLLGKDHNFSTLVVENGQVIPVQDIVGNGFFVSWLGEDFVSLDKEQIQRIKKMFVIDRKICVAVVR